MKAIVTAVTVLWLASRAPVCADTVELGGFACLFGVNMALFDLYKPAQNTPVHFTLAEGETQYDIKLVQVDVAKHRVQIEQNGVTQYLRLCAAPDLSTPANPLSTVAREDLTPEQRQAIVAQIKNSEASRRIVAGKPDLTLFSSAAAKAGTKAGQDASTGSNTANTPGTATASAGNGGGATAASSSTDITDQYWYKQALIIEQARISSASDVLDGQATAWPLTPLTPAGTAIQLIGKETFFSNHMPAGYIVPGYVDPLAAAQ